MFARGWTDGLPVVPPTEQRVLAMLDGTTRAADDVVASVPPDLVDVTVEKVAIAAVMAGCRPEYLPWVLTTIEAMCTDEFNIHGVLGDDDAGRPGHRVQWAGHGGDRDEQWRQRARSGQPRQPDDRAGGAARRAQRRGWASGRCRPGDARQSRQAVVLLRRAARLALRNAGREPRRTGGGQRHHGVRRRRAAVHRRPAVAGAGEPRQIAGRMPADVAPPQARARRST